MTPRTLTLGLALSLVACAGPRQADRTPVPEGINDSFLAEDLDVQGFVDRWELESREVYAARLELLAALELEPGARVADRELGLDQVEVVLSNDRSTELPENSVDVVFLCDVYHHFEYHEDMLHSIRRALKPGGRFVFVDFHRVEGVTREWLLGHVRAGQEVFRAEVEAAGFVLLDEVEKPAFEDNYCLRFVAP